MWEQLHQPVFGNNSILAVLLFAGSLVLTIIAYRVVHWLFSGYLIKLTRKTKTDLDDIILDSLRGPAKFAVLIGGLLFSLRTLDFGKQIGPWINMTVLASVILLAAFALARVVNILVKRYLLMLRERSNEQIDDNIMVMVQKFINGSIWVVAILLVLSNYGVNITSAVAGLGLGGLAVAMAAKDTLSNMFGGVIIFIDRPFRIGDVIEFDGEFGVVEEIGMRSLRIRTLQGFMLTIPNSMFAQSGVKNLSGGEYRRVELVLGLVYDTSADELEKAKAIIKDVIGSTEGVLKDREPLIYFDNFGDSSLDMKVYYWTVFDWNEHVTVKDRINMQIKRRFDEEGIGFAFPTMTLDIPKIPQDTSKR